MQLIRGDSLTPPQRDEVLRTFVHRWTENLAEYTFVMGGMHR